MGNALGAGFDTGYMKDLFKEYKSMLASSMNETKEEILKKVWFGHLNSQDSPEFAAAIDWYLEHK